MPEKTVNYRRTKYTCFYTYLAMSSVFSLPPLLFLTFREKYGISYTLLGTLVLVNFITQLTIDLIFTFFSRHFNVKKVVRAMPLITSAGLFTYALIPTFFPDAAYAGLLAGTVIFSIAAGLNEVLLSPLIAALPSDNPDRDMSMLHSLYAWGVLTVVTVSTLFLKIFGTDNWMLLTMFWACLPIVSCILFCTSPIPDMDLSQSPGGGKAKNRRFGMALCVLCIFLGSAAENGMTNWISVFVESALGVPKVAGDILGLAAFAVLLGLVRTFYAKYGKNIAKVLLISMVGAIFCYLIASLSPLPVISMIACVVTGAFTSMLWPGTLILMEEKFPAPGVTAYALMAAGGDFGASVAPQLLGYLVDEVSPSSWAASLAGTLSLTPEQVAMKFSMLIGALFPVLGTLLLLYMHRYFAAHGEKNEGKISGC